MDTLKAQGCLILALMLLAASARAQSTGLSGFDLHLYRPPADGSGVLNLHGSKTLNRWKFRLGLVTEASHGLMAATNPTTGQSVRVVDDFITSNLQGAVGITRFLQAGLNLPVVFFEKGTNLNTAQGFNTASIGDISLDLKLNFLRDEGWRPGLALISMTSFPSGDTGKFTGYSKVSEEVRLTVDKKIGSVYLVANTGYRTIGRTQVVGLDIDDRVTFGGGVAWTLPLADRSVDLMGEVDGTRVLRSPQELTTPIEWVVGLRKRFEGGLTAQVGGGRGITTGVGGGEWRALAGLHWSPTFKAGKKEEGQETLLETVYFGFNKDQFLPKYRPKLDIVAKQIETNKLTIRGHTDNEGTEEYNLGLSHRRAKNVADYLIKKGVTSITTEGIGSKEPMTNNRTMNGKAQNRRVEILAEH